MAGVSKATSREAPTSLNILEVTTLSPVDMITLLLANTMEVLLKQVMADKAATIKVMAVQEATLVPERVFAL